MPPPVAWQTDDTFWLNVADQHLEARAWGPPPDEAPTLVLLHEGLGCVQLWRDFPDKLANTTGFGVFAYSRAGYGQSNPTRLPWPLDYMTLEARNVLPHVLHHIGIQRGVLLGHSDGASIAAIYAGTTEDVHVRGLCLIAPHFFTEPDGLSAIADAKAQYETGTLRARLAKYHDDPENAFRGWNDAWLDPGFRDWNIEDVIKHIRIPTLVIQGRDDMYGTLAQIQALENGISSPLETEILDECQHAPHLEQSEKTRAAIAQFLERLETIEMQNVKVT